LALIRVRNLWQKVKRLEGVKISSTLSSSWSVSYIMTWGRCAWEGAFVAPTMMLWSQLPLVPLTAQGHFQTWRYTCSSDLKSMWEVGPGSEQTLQDPRDLTHSLKGSR
jgi:hypothetical protein